MEITKSTTVDYLRMMAEVSKMSGHSSSWYEFVLTHGREFPDKGNLSSIEASRGKMKECYANATHLMLDSFDLVYVEGFAFSMIPTQHAWVYSKSKGLIFDNTWKDGRDYFGIPINRFYLMRHMVETEYYGLTNWSKPLIMEADPSEFKEKLEAIE